MNNFNFIILFSTHIITTLWLELKYRIPLIPTIEWFVGFSFHPGCPGECGKSSTFRFRVVREKLGEAVVGQRMLEEAFDGAQRTGHDVCTDFCTLDDVHGVPHTRRKDFSSEIIIVVNDSNFLNELQSVRADVIDASQGVLSDAILHQ